MEKIADFFKNIIMLDPKFNSINPIDDLTLLFPDFLSQVNNCIKKYRETYPNQNITFTETYRSNVLQEKYFKNGASKIRKDGMHHFGIAVDCIFIINGKRSYKGDINLIRKIFKNNGLTILGMWDPLHVQYISVSSQQELRNLCNSK